MEATLLKILDYIEKTVPDLSLAVSRGNLKATGTGIIRLRSFSESLKAQLPIAFTNEVLADFDRHLSFMEQFLNEENFEYIRKNLDDIRDFDLPRIKQALHRLVEKTRVQYKK